MERRDFLKSAVVYYSLEGNTRYVAEKIAEILQSDVIELKPVKSYKTGKLSKFIWGGKAVLSGDEPELMPYTFRQELYDLIVIGTPIWASSLTPPIRTFLKKETLENKNIAICTCNGGGPSDKCIDQMESMLSSCNIKATLDLFDPVFRPRQENEDRIIQFANTLLKTTK